MIPNKTALITGGSSGLGLEITRYLYKESYEIIVHCFNSTITAKELKDQKIILDYFSCDLKNTKSIMQLFHFACKKFGRNIDLLINNAAEFQYDDCENFDYDVLNNALTLNAIAPILLNYQMRKQNNSTIINILDTMVEGLYKKFFSYSLSKKLLMEATKIQAAYYAPNIRLNGISIGPIKQKPSQKTFDKISINNPMGHKVSISQMCDTISFLVKSKNITGQIIYLDGGKNLDLKQI